MEPTDKLYPHIVSFPRSGSHWVRAIIEIYTRTPKEEFKYSTARTVNHVHDFNNNTEYYNVMYLYRNLFDTMYSAMIYYYGFALYNKDFLDILLKRYVNNLRKWLLDETFTHKKTIITYDKLMNDKENEFKKIFEHIEIDFDYEKLLTINLSKEYIKEKLALTSNDKKIVNLSEDYLKNKQIFRDKYREYIYDKAFQFELRLKPIFEKEI